jgi:hypothetical protein
MPTKMQDLFQTNINPILISGVLEDEKQPRGRGRPKSSRDRKEQISSSLIDFTEGEPAAAMRTTFTMQEKIKLAEESTASILKRFEKIGVKPTDKRVEDVLNVRREARERMRMESRDE